MADPIDGLFEVAPEEFTAARDRLAGSLKDAGDAEAAGRVKKLKRPTVPAWALNQLVRRHGEAVRGLLEVGEALRGAQRKAISGARDSGFREAAERRRELVRELTGRARDILAGRGGAGAEDDVARSLEAASVDPAAAEALLAGRLERPLSSDAGFGAVSGLEVIEGGDAGGGPSDVERRARDVAVRNAERQAEEAEADARRAGIRADELERQAEDVARRAAEARHAADRLRDEASRAAERAAGARDERDR